MADFNLLVISLFLFILSLVSTKTLIYFSNKYNLVVYPNSERWSKTIVAQNGGISFVFVYIFSFIFFYKSLPNFDYLYVLILSFSLGLYDDFYHLKPSNKLFVQLIITLFVIYIVIINNHIDSKSLLIFLIICGTLITVSISNAINIIDNVDGLCSIVVFIVSGSFFLLSFKQQSEISFYLSLFTMIITLSFLFFNWNPAKIFMGDCGSMQFGFLVSYLFLSINCNTNMSIYQHLLTINLIAYPVIETILISFRRVLSGKSFLNGGRDHFSHRLIYFGYKEKNAVLILGAIQLIYTIFYFLLISHFYEKIILIIYFVYNCVLFLFLFRLLLIPVYEKMNEEKFLKNINYRFFQ
jgi:UDP-GlcNAc:undecaprenyl-phosphate GlcNAc-1-phosphate transferase